MGTSLVGEQNCVLARAGSDRLAGELCSRLAVLPEDYAFRDLLWGLRCRSSAGRCRLSGIVRLTVFRHGSLNRVALFTRQEGRRRCARVQVLRRCAV